MRGACVPCPNCGRLWTKLRQCAKCGARRCYLCIDNHSLQHRDMLDP